MRLGLAVKLQLPVRPLSCYRDRMASSTRDNMKRKRPEQTGVLVGVRLQPDQLAALDTWISQQPAPKPTRPAAIRAMVQASLQLMGDQ